MMKSITQMMEQNVEPAELMMSQVTGLSKSSILPFEDLQHLMNDDMELLLDYINCFEKEKVEPLSC